ncbi:MAG: class II aldolase/adducin family protein [Acidimicrobiales bacterium]
MGVDELTLRSALLDTCRRFGPQGLSQGTSGNASVRCGDGMLITPSAMSYETMTPADVVWLGFDGTRRGEHPPSSEWRFHRAIFERRPDAGAIVHVHSPAATALACLRLDIPAFHYMVAVAGGDSIRCAPYVLFGTERLAEAVVAALTDRSAALLANHGQVALGADLDAALKLAIEVETLADQYLRARTVGQPHLLSPAEMAEVLDRFVHYRTGTLS